MAKPKFTSLQDIAEVNPSMALTIEIYAIHGDPDFGLDLIQELDDSSIMCNPYHRFFVKRWHGKMGAYTSQDFDIRALTKELYLLGEQHKLVVAKEAL